MKSKKLSQNEGNNNSLWEIMKDLIGTNLNSTPKCFENGLNNESDPEKITNMFNYFFVNIGPSLASKISLQTDFKQYLDMPCHITLFLRLTDHQEIITIVKSLKPNSSTGFDGISVNLLKKVTHSIIDPLLHVFNLSIKSRSCPDFKKIPTVIQVFKKDDYFFNPSI